MDKLYYTAAEVMQMFNIGKDNYSTFGKICRKHKLPRLKIGKCLLFPVAQFDKRIAIVNKELMKNFNIAR